MFKRYIKLFIKNSEDVQNPSVREKYGKLSGVTGIVLNIFMSLIKIITGAILGAISILSDGINNLSDAGSSIVTFVGFKLSSKKPDKEHPFGHGRIEYFAGLAVSVIIIVVAIELFIESIKKIIGADGVIIESNVELTVSCIVLGISILIKLWMAFFNRFIGKKINSVVVSVTALDSISDCISTFVVLVCSILSVFLKDVPLDGIAGLVVSAFILYTGIKSAKDVIELLLGSAPDPELVKKIAEYVENFDENIIGVHDLMIHDYGPGRIIVILHVEVPAKGDILALHDIIDNIETGLGEKFNCLATIHLDPVETDNERVKELKNVCIKIVTELNPEYMLHDFRMNEGETHANLIFDLVITHATKMSDNEIRDYINKKLKEYDPKLNAIVKVEYSMI